MTQTQGNPLGFADPKKLLIQFTIPSIFSMTASSLYNLVDQMFIGWKVGIIGNAATNVAFPLTTILLALSLIIGIGSSSRFGMEMGRGNKAMANKAVGNAILMMVIAGVVVMAVTLVFLHPLMTLFGATPEVLPYAATYVRITAIGFPFFMFFHTMCALIRMDGSPKYSMFSILIGCIINVILDPVLMFGFDMGIEGAAYATVISQIISFVFTFVYLFRMKQVQLTKASFIPDIKNCFKNLSLGFSTFVTQISITIVQIVLNNALVIYGAMSIYGAEIPLGAAGVILKVNTIVVNLFIAISQGSQPLYSFNMGAKKYDRVKAVYKQAIKMSLYISIVALIVFEVFPKPLLMLFGETSDLYFAFGIPFMRVYLCMIILNGIQVLSTNIMAAIGMPVKGSLLAIVRYIVLPIPLILIIPMFAGIDGIKFAGAITDAVAAIISILVVYMTFKKLVLPVEDTN
ncbi:MAG: MATE family efflux transporter [Eubacterium sp.]|nr:MATE family efflux transporter [Eubacterium sp.]